MEDLFEFAKVEHERQVTHHNVKGDPKTKYTMLAKLMEELGELSEAILTCDSLQRSDKLTEKIADARANLEGEFADVILVAAILSHELGVDVKAALHRKIKKIRERKY
jgi:NTP pyrophosphatase (non-canonical NTP hydrolase)